MFGNDDVVLLMMQEKITLPALSLGSRILRTLIPFWLVSDQFEGSPWHVEKVCALEEVNFQAGKSMHFESMF